MAASCPDNSTPNDGIPRVILENDIQQKPNQEDGSPVVSPTPKEPFMGNVNWHTPLPPDMAAHPIVKGMLTFDAAYENGKDYVSIATVHIFLCLCY